MKTLICFENTTCATLLILLLLDNILQTWLSLFMLNLLLLCGFHASCSSACRMGALTLSSLMGSLPSGHVIELEN